MNEAPRVYPPALLDALEAVQIAAVAGTAWRQVLLPTAALRANRRGARWNPSDVEALYCSVEPDTAAAEIDYLMSSQPVPITRQRVTYALDVQVSGVGDLRSTPDAPSFDYPLDPQDSAVCELVGGAAAWLGLGGLLVPSVRSNGVNLVIYVANMGASDHYELAEKFDEGFPHPPGPPADLDLPDIVLRKST